MVVENSRSPVVDAETTYGTDGVEDSRPYPPFSVAVFTKHWPSKKARSAGIFVQRWCEMLDGAYSINSGAKHADIIAAHWLWPAGFRALFYSLWYRKPLMVVLYGDPYMYEGYWWVRLAAFPILWRARIIQVISSPCARIMRRSMWAKKVWEVPVR